MLIPLRPGELQRLIPAVATGSQFRAALGSPREILQRVMVAAIGGVIERHMIATGFIAGEGLGLKTDPQAKVVGLDAPRGKACPSCGQFDLRMVEGCMTCGSCGHSKCG